jgi:chromosome segregation ATPase
LERKKSADELAALQCEFEEANARSTSLQLAINEQKASFELERKETFDKISVLQQAYDDTEKNLKQTTESHNTAIKAIEEQKSTNAQVRQQLQQQQTNVESKDAALSEFETQLRNLTEKVDKHVRFKQQLEEQLEQKSRENLTLRSEHTAEPDLLVSKNEKQLGEIPKLKQDLEKVTTELTDSQCQVQELQVQRDTAVTLQTRQNELHLSYINDLKASLDNVKLELTNTQSKVNELEVQHTQEVAQKDEEINGKTKELDEQRSQVKDLTGRREKSRERISELEQQLAIVVSARAAEEAKPDSEDATTTNTPTPANTADHRTDRLKPEPSLNWSKHSRRNDWKWCVRAGIVQQGPYPDRQLMQLTLPHADSFYSDLPVPIPRPCIDSDEGEKHTCKQCLERYVKAAFHDHGPLCMLFFSNHAATCKHCKKQFVLNSVFQEHEKYCGKYRTSGAAPRGARTSPFRGRIRHP